MAYFAVFPSQLCFGFGAKSETLSLQTERRKKMGYDAKKDLSYRDREPIEDPNPFVPATKPQLNYIQILANDLELSENTRDVHIASIIKRPFKWIDGMLSKGEASNVIGKFKEWKDAQRDAKRNLNA
jgi:hypothetical protein